MYVPDAYEVKDTTLIYELIRNYPFATLIVSNAANLVANHIPLCLKKQADQKIVLQGHVARNNPLWSTLVSDNPALAIFHGPSAYISPSWYATKKETGRVVPTWNYMVVHVHGSLSAIEDPLWLREHLQHLTAQQEQEIPEPWTMEDAPAEFIENMINAVVGVEMHVESVTAKFKISQGQSNQNKVGVIRGLQQRQLPFDLLMARWVETHTIPDQGSL